MSAPNFGFLDLLFRLAGAPFEVVEVLARSPGELVTKDELMNRICPGAIVMENTLRFT